MNPTTKQIEALRNFKVPEEKIQALNIGQASEMIAQLIGHARTNGNGVRSKKEDERLSQVRDNLDDAGKIVMEYFGIKDKSKLKEAHIALIQETSRQVYGLKYWVEKSNTRLDRSSNLKPDGE